MKVLITAFILLFILQFAAGQRIIVNSNGEKIVMFPDGSWRLLEAGDSALVRQHLQKSGASGFENGNVDPALKRTAAEEEEYLIRQWNELHFNIRSLEKKIQNEFRVATNAQFSAAEIYFNAESNKKLIEPDRLAIITENYHQSIANLKVAKQNQNDIRKLMDQSRKLANMPAKKLGPRLNSLRSKYNIFLQNYRAQRPGEKNIPPEMQELAETKIPKKKSPPVSTTAKEAAPKSLNVKLLPPGSQVKPYRSAPFRCAVKSDTTDRTTGMRHIELEPGLLFTHTDPDLRPYFKNKELITCYGKLYKTNDYVYLTIDFQIASSHSQSNFGSLEKGSLLRLKLLNGEYVSLYNLRADRGRIDAYSGYTIFTGQYVLGKDQIKMLISNELDKVRILWSTGYEDYDVYEVDFFLDRLNCLLTR